MKMNNATHTYEMSGQVDLEVWREKVKAAGADKRYKASAAMKPVVDFKETYKAVRQMVAGGPVPQAEIVARLVGEQKLTQRDAKNVIKTASQTDKKFLTVKRSNTVPSMNMCSLIEPASL